ncbi:MAG: peptide deformylase [Alphaproteobacteria bacterium]|jgi:peptide deformylase|nr:peptide deformylase [Alphaproteobacteria bacterium]
MLQMKLCGDLVLREHCVPVDDITPEILKNMDEMVKMMRNQNGVGLAAPQVGVTKRFLVMMNPETEEVFKMINPKIIERSTETVVMEEGCLSVLGPDDLPVYANVSRPAVVTIEWMGVDGKNYAAEMSGIMARIAQHETDHLDGVLFIDYLPAAKREMVMRKVRRRK